jgi:hypothetical protein
LGNRTFIKKGKIPRHWKCHMLLDAGQVQLLLIIVLKTGSTSEPVR